MSPRILVVDDDATPRRLLEILVRRFGYAVETADGGAAALARLADPLAPPPDLMLLDLAMPDPDGMAVLERMRAVGLTVPAIAMTPQGSIEAATSALRAGAVDFVVKPDGAERLQAAIRNALRLAALEAEIRRLQRHDAGAASFEDLAGESPDMARAAELGERAAQSSMPVLLEGEPGVGTDVFARALFAASARRGRPFVPVKCSALRGDAIDRVLFGEGAAPFGGGGPHPGKCREADGGVLFLDDIGALPLAMQAKLLRVLQRSEVEPLGAARPAPVDFRLIAATRPGLIDRVRAGRFREDLFYRLNVHPIGIPPLRRRPADIGPLARRFCARFAAEENKRVRGVGAGALALLAAHDWPGNVRQLEHAVYRAVVLAEGDELTVADFPQIAACVPGFQAAIPRAPRAPSPATRAPECASAEPRDPASMPLLDEAGALRRLDALEAEAIRFALVHYRGRMSAMARKLGIGRSTLYRKIKEYGLAPAESGGADGLALALTDRPDAAA